LSNFSGPKNKSRETENIKDYNGSPEGFYSKMLCLLYFVGGSTKYHKQTQKRILPSQNYR
jgi:hypothetical protein